MDSVSLVNYWTSSSDRDYKNEFYERCTPEYTKEQIENIKEVRVWLKEMLM